MLPSIPVRTLLPHARDPLQAVLPVIAVLVLTALAGCASTAAPPASVPLDTPAQWQAPLPHQGSLGQLSEWWRQQGDPLLLALIDAAQVASPSVATARANIERARATQVRARAELMPKLDAAGSVSRSQNGPANGAAAPVSLLQAGLQSSWEIDVFGYNRAVRDASDARLDGSQALWHDARVSVAAETARQYYALRTCARQLTVSQADTRSRLETARLSALASKAGFEAPATTALARASAAQSRAKSTQQQALCDLDIKALVALTGLAEPQLRDRLAAFSEVAQQDLIPVPVVASVPAQALAQRPDVLNAARLLAAASFDVAGSRAERYPRLSLSGAVTAARISGQGARQSYNTWSIGPLSLTLPLLDGGASRAQVDAARALYEEAATAYRNTARQAVREVEEALVNLQSTADQIGDAATAADGYRASFAGTEARYKAGLASLVELEDSRRTLLAAQSALVSLELERRRAWIALYRALGGGWTTDTPQAAPIAQAIPVVQATPVTRHQTSESYL